MEQIGFEDHTYNHRGSFKACEHLCICVRGSLAHYSDDLEVSFVISLM